MISSASFSSAPAVASTVFDVAVVGAGIVGLRTRLQPFGAASV
jgi:hypothetical protein